MGMDYRTDAEEIDLPTDDLVARYSRDEELLARSYSRGEEEIEEGEGEPQVRGRRAPRTFTGSLEQDKILCRICGDTAVRHIHYGGHCCFSCKAFFRRAVHHQTKTSRSFKCKFDDACEINIKNRKTCQSCRFKKCVSTGMNPSWVLSDDQRKKRFKKYRDQKGGNMNESGDLGSPDSASNDLDFETLTNLPTLAERPGTGRRRVKSAPDRATPGGMGETPQHQQGRPRGSRKYGGGHKSGVMARSGGLGLHCGGNCSGLATASQPVSPVDSIGSIDFGHSSNSWIFPDVVKTELDDNYAFNSLKQDVQNGFVTSPVKLEPVDSGSCQVEGIYTQMDNLNVHTMDTSRVEQMASNIKEEEVDINNELDADQLDRLQTLIASVDFNSLVNLEVETPPVMNKRPMFNTQLSYQSDQAYNSYPCTPDAAVEPRIPPSFTPLPSQGCNPGTPLSIPGTPSMPGTPSIPGTPLYCELTQEEMMSIMKLEMSFENSNASFPLMSEETSRIWERVVSSCNFNLLNNTSSATNILNEAVELCLKRNLIFLQENSDFTSLTLETRTQLYINNMGSMCHVRGILCGGGSGSAGVGASGGRNGTRQAFGSNFTLSSQPDNSVQISYKDRQTGKLRLWKIENGLGDMNFGSAGNVQLPGASARVDDKNLLELAEQISCLELGMVPYIIMLLMVLFSSQGCTTLYSGIVDSLQNRYLSLMYRYLQSTYDQPRAKKYMTVIMKFVISLLSKSY